MRTPGNVATAAAFLASCTSLLAVTTSGDSSLYTSTAGSVFAGVAILSAGGDTCSASLISGNLLLTAAHCLTGVLDPSAVSVTFALAAGGPATYSVANFFRDGPLVDGDYSNDIALVQLTAAVSGITPYALGASMAGETITLAGYGDMGQGTLNPGSYGTFHAGLNTLDGYWDGITQTNSINGSIYTLPNEAGALAYDFDLATGNGSLGGAAVSGVAPQNEVMICFGDSGGPAFAGNAFQGGPLTIVGVNDFLSFPNPGDTSMNTPQCTNDESAAGYAGFGDIGGDTNVATHLDFINSTIAAVDGTPEPATWALMGVGFAGLALKRRWRFR